MVVVKKSASKVTEFRMRYKQRRCTHERVQPGVPEIAFLDFQRIESYLGIHADARLAPEA